MTAIIGGFVTSHATALVEPGRWDDVREMVGKVYADRYGEPPAEVAELAAESRDVNERRYAPIRETYDLIAQRIQELKPDAVILFGNDQNENFVESGYPQMAIYTGETVLVDDYLSKQQKEYRGAPEIAEVILEGCVSRGFDVTRVKSFSGGKLKAHAHAQVFMRFIPEANVPVIPIFINAITPPLVSVRRCFEFGRAIAAALAESAPGKRVMIGASGGLSHFTAGFPYEILSEDRQFGMICESFDRKLLSWIESGELSKIADLASEDLVNNGDVEFRQAISFFGAMAEGTKPTQLLYEPFYRGLMGFWAGYWDKCR